MNDWLRPAASGVLNGLVSNATLILLLADGGASRHAITFGGAAVLLAGALAVGTGQCIAVTDQNELAGTGLPLPVLARFAAAAEQELAGCFRRYGADSATAARMAAAVCADEQLAPRLRAREKLGVNPLELPSPFLSGLASAAAFAAGALVPLLPYLAGKPDLTLALALAAAAAALVYPWRARSRLMTIRWIWLVPSKICMVVNQWAVSSGQRPSRVCGVSTDSARVFRRPLLLASPPGLVEGGAGAIPGGRDEVAVDLVGDLYAVVTKPTGQSG